MIRIVERNNPLAVHGHFDSIARAEHHLAVVIPQYVARGFFSDKTLTANDFVIVAPLSTREG